MKAGKKPQWIPPETVSDVLRRIAAAEYRCDIARSCGVSEYSVTKIAQRNGVMVTICPRGSRWGRLQRAEVAAATETEKPINWRAVAAGLRWGGRGSHHYD